MPNKYKFSKTGNDWFIELPEYLEAGGVAEDLQMVEGADKMLDMIAGIEDTVVLYIASEKFDGADLLILKEKCDPAKGGGIYFLATFEARLFNHTLWLCKVTEFVLGGIPAEIYLKRDNVVTLK